MRQEHSLTPARIVGYGFGDVGFNLFYTGLNLFLLNYYTDVLGIAPATAGLIFMLPVLWDAVTDPLMGWVATRTRSRFGKYRVYLLFGTPLMCASFVLMFAAPVIFPGAVVLSAAAAHVLFRTVYTVVNVPYSALSASMTSDTDIRSSLAGIRMFSGLIGGLIAGSLTLALAIHFGGENLAVGFISVAAIYGAIAMATIFISFFASFEVELPEQDMQQITFAETRSFLASNRAFWILALAIFVSGIFSSIGNKSTLYYVTYVLGDKAAYGPLLFAALFTSILSVPVWLWISRRWSKRAAWVTATLGTAAVQFALYLVVPKSLSAMLPYMIASGLFLIGPPIMMWSMLPDTVEYGQWRSGVRDEAIGFGLMQLALKAASGLGVGLLGLALGWAGYVANEVQTPGALESIRVLSFLAPSIGAALGAVLIAFYPIDRGFHEKLLGEIAAKAS